MAKNDKQIKDGREAEDNFTKIYPLINRATRDEDIFDHWDVEVKIKDDFVKVDVKALKNESRNEPFPNENFHWVEIQNVNGDTGWLYGKSDLIAFETSDYFILVGTLKLRRFLEKKLGFKKETIKDIITGNSKDPYLFYRRKERNDIVVKVKTMDLMHIKYLSVKKI